MSDHSQHQAPPAEERYAEELALLESIDDGPKPEGWRLSPRRVVEFICGTSGEKIKLPKGAKAAKGAPKSLEISEKFIGGILLQRHALARSHSTSAGAWAATAPELTRLRSRTIEPAQATCSNAADASSSFTNAFTPGK